MSLWRSREEGQRERHREDAQGGGNGPRAGEGGREVILRCCCANERKRERGEQLWGQRDATPAAGKGEGGGGRSARLPEEGGGRVTCAGGG